MSIARKRAKVKKKTRAAKKVTKRRAKVTPARKKKPTGKKKRPRPVSVNTKPPRRRPPKPKPIKRKRKPKVRPKNPKVSPTPKPTLEQIEYAFLTSPAVSAQIRDRIVEKGLAELTRGMVRTVEATMIADLIIAEQLGTFDQRARELALEHRWSLQDVYELWHSPETDLNPS